MLPLSPPVGWWRGGERVAEGRVREPLARSDLLAFRLVPAATATAAAASTEPATLLCALGRFTRRSCAGFARNFRAWRPGRTRRACRLWLLRRRLLLLRLTLGARLSRRGRAAATAATPPATARLLPVGCAGHRRRDRCLRLSRRTRLLRFLLLRLPLLLGPLLLSLRLSSAPLVAQAL